jgi:cell division protein ZapE
MLMDLFYDNVPMTAKKRLHFHEFMTEIHGILRILRQAQKTSTTHNLIIRAANIFAQNCSLLCLDELTTLDTASAMIIGKLFQALRKKLVIVCTSNKAPVHLYGEILQREYFLKFVCFVENSYNIVELLSSQDYRLSKIKSLSKIFIFPVEETTPKQMRECFMSLIHYSQPVTKVLEVRGRELRFSQTYGDVGIFSFAELCCVPLGAEDYHEMSKFFSIILLENITKLMPEHRNEAKRFMNLIDELYQNKLLLICSCEVAVEEIYQEGFGAEEFGRTISRLQEMQSEEYLQRCKKAF